MSILRLLDHGRVLALSLAALASAQAADDIAGQRARIAAERAAVLTRARTGEAACASEFAVSACVKAVRAERRAALQQLDRQRALLDDAQRKQRAAERVARLRERQEAAARDSERPPVEVKTRAPHAAAPERSASQASAEQARRTAHAAQAASAVAAGDAKAAERAAASARREREAATHRALVEKRNQAQAQKKPPAKPLPAPASAPS